VICDCVLLLHSLSVAVYRLRCILLLESYQGSHSSFTPLICRMPLTPRIIPCELGGYDISTGSPSFKYFAISDLLLPLILFIFQITISLWQLYGKTKFDISLEIYIWFWSFELCAYNGTKIVEIGEELRKLS
jgi:hypothetical protein